jgi:Ser/Thr protein kinase RdoA (MazF antagonist)
LVAVDVLGPDDATVELAGRWGADSRTLSPITGATNRVYQCESAVGPLYLRLTTSPTSTLPLIGGSLDWQRHVHRAGAPVAEPVVSRAGFWIESTSSGSVTLYATAVRGVPGRPVGFHNFTEVEAWAETVGAVHAASASFAPSPISTSEGTVAGRLPTLLEFWKAIEPIADGDPLLRSRYMQGSDWLARLGEPRLVTHGDVRPANALFDHGRVVLLDFDEPTWAWEAYDLARMMLDDDAGQPEDAALHRSALLNG